MRKMRYYPQVIANKMQQGLVHEQSKIWEMRRVLRNDEELPETHVDYYMNVDEDFIPDVIQAYNALQAYA